ncbi:cytochrome c3 family protein, partial [Chloroflexota bacterium]
MVKITWRIIATFALVISISAVTTMEVMAVDGGVKQVSVSVADEINPGDNLTISVTVVTGNSTGDAWTGTITVTDPASADHVAAISGTGSATVTKTYVTDFDNTPTTSANGTYSISAAANITGETAVTGTGSFDVKNYYLSVSSSPIAKSATLTITVNTVDTSWGGTITVTEPSAGGGQTATYPFSGQNGDQTTTAFPGGGSWSGTADTASAGVYTVSFVETGSETDNITFDVQDSNPHVGTGFTDTTYACAGCHRTHVGAAAAKLLKSATQIALCESCHDGTGANTNVMDGRYLGNTEGTLNAGLRGGGFTNAYMDPNVDGTLSSTAITSKHTVGATSPIVWGSGVIGQNDAGETISTMECGSCHNPHGNSQYRILRPQPTGLVTDAPSADVTIADSLETTKNYTIGYDTNYYRNMGEYPTGVLSQMTEWCGQCHERYEANAGSGRYDRGDTVFKYSHMTEGIGGECLKCHVAHGTSASMSGNAGSSGNITWP